MTKLRYAWLASSLMLAGIVQAQGISVQVELMNQIGTDTSRKGDLISGRVVTPAHLAGDIVEGRITESRSGAKLGGQSAFSFTFDVLRHGGTAIPIASQFRSAVNSQGRANVDEEGRIVKRASGNVGKAAGGTGAGALIGGLAGGKKGAAIGAVVGAGASIAAIEIAADAPNIRFGPGSRVMIEAAGRNGALLPTTAAATGVPVTAPPPAQQQQTIAVYQPPPPAAAAPVQVAAAPAQVSAPSAQGGAAPAASSPQPEMTTLKSAFIPGEKTIFFDDFTDMTAGDAPPHFKIRGAAPELRAAGAIRQLTALAKGSMFPNLTSLPKNFTYEVEMKLDPQKRISSFLVLAVQQKEYFHLGMFADRVQMDLQASLRAPYSELGRKRIPMTWNEPMKLALWVQNGRMRVFVNGEKHLDFNQVELPEITNVELRNDMYAGDSLGFRSFRFAESTPDFSQVISSSGRFVTHGILFDTGSDRLKPESAPVIQSIAKGLETNPNLKLHIEGHTDSVGNAAANMDLSKRRAEAVKAVLTTQFSVDASRLTTAGLGATKPMDSNDTPQGRAQNRRVEFVKL